MRNIIFKIIFILPAVLSFTGAAAQDHVVINEVMSSNTRGNYDSDFGAFSDWIELYNPTGAAISLEGWFLSDDPGNPDKWEIPENTVLPAGGYLLFWADDRDVVPGQTAYVEFTEVHEITVEEYHLNFRINRDREEIILVDPGRMVVDSVYLRDQERDISYGRQPGNPGQMVYLGEPTPLAENSSYFAETITRSDRPLFSQPGGMYEAAQEVVLQPPATGITIRYTTDGSEPNSNSPVYTAPLPILFSQVIKARCYESGKLPGEVVTASYIIGKETHLPVLSVSTDHRNLWGFDFGLYQNNYKNREIFAHLEYFDETGTKGFGTNAGLQLFGSQIFLFDQKPLSVFFRNRYGPEALDYRLFSKKTLSTYESLVLRNGGNDNNLTMFRDGLGAALVEGQADIDHQAYRPVVVYMNGEYWGIFNIREKLNEEYLQGNHGVNPDHVDILEDSLVVNNGDANRYHELLGYAQEHNLAMEEHYDWVAGQIDMDAYINYMGYKIWGGYKQWQVNNKYWRERLPGERWRWIAFDLEHAFGGPGGETYESNTFITALETGSGADGWYILLFRKLMQNEGFRAQFLQRLALFMDTFLSELRVLSVIDSLENTIAPEMPAHILRWESPVSVAAWQQHVNMLREFGANRNPWMYRHILEYFSLSDTAEITIQHTEGGRVLVCSSGVVADGTASFTLFKGLPVQLKAFPDPGFRFTGWSNGSADQDYLLHIAGDTTVTAMFEASSAYMLPDTVRNTLVIGDATHPWVAGGNIVIPEGDTLIIKEGITVRMFPGASVINHGALFVHGTAGNPVIFQTFPQPGIHHSSQGKQRWGGIIAQAADTTRIVHAVLENASSGLDYGDYKAAITVVRSGLLMKGVEISGVVNPVYAYKSQVLIDSCRLSSNGTGDLIHIHACRDAVIRGCDLKGNFYEDTDAIDLDSVTGALVERNMVYSFFGSNSDGIDMGEQSTGIVIRGNTIKSISDKGISVGQGSEIVAEQNVIVDCNQGFGIKDFHSFAHINQNTLYANRTGIAVFEKNTGNGGGAAHVENTIVAGSIEASVFVDDLSTLTVTYSLSDRDNLQGYNNLHGDPGFAGAANLGFALAEGSVCIDGGTPNQTDPDGTRADIGVFLPAGEPAGHPVIITEVNYNSHPAFNSGDWVELFNGGTEVIDLSGWIMKGQEPGDEFVFGYDASLPPGEYLVVARSSDSLELLFPGASLAHGDIAWGLSSDGELIRLYDDSNRLVYTMEYGTGHPWPDGPNGKGATLELFAASFSVNYPGSRSAASLDSGLSNVATTSHSGGSAILPTSVQTNFSAGSLTGSPAGWHSSYIPGGTPGRQNSTFEEVTGLYINELMAKNDYALADEAGEYDDWLEVYNSNPHAVDMGGVHFIYGDEEQRVTMVPYFAGDTTVVPAGGYKLFWADKDPEQGALHLDFNLPVSGGSVGIGQVSEQEVWVSDMLSYGALGADVAFGRFPDGDVFLSFLNMTPGNSNLLLGAAPSEGSHPGWRIYPNPATDVVIIEFSETMEYGEQQEYGAHHAPGELHKAGAHSEPGAHSEAGELSEPGASREPGTVLLYSGSGQCLRTIPLAPGQQTIVDISGLERGVYLLRLQGSDLSAKLVVR